MRKTSLVPILLCVSGLLLASPNYTGYSGAPGSRGSCAGSCHGSAGGTVAVTGFPSLYTPGDTYVVKLKRASGSTINNFNASVRIGSGSQTAGTITAGLNTSTYNRTEEPNGVHLSSNNRDSCTFNWVAPAGGTGDCNLYVAAHQGSSTGGPNTVLTLTAGEGTGVSENGPTRTTGLSLELQPTLVTTQLVMRVCGTPNSRASLRVVDAGGRLVARFAADGPNTAVLWTPVDEQGDRLPDGAYFAVLTGSGERLVRRFVLKAD